MRPARRSLAVRLFWSGVVLLLVVVAVAAGGLWWLLSSDRVRTTLEEQASVALGEPVRIERASPALLPRPGVRLFDITIGERADVASLREVEVSTGLRPLLARRIEGAEIIVSGGYLDLGAALGLLRLPVSGEAGTGAAPDGASPGGLELASIRALVLQSVDLRAGGTALGTSARARWDGERLEIERFEATGAGSRLSLAGTVTGGAAPMATLALQAEELDADALMAVAAVLAPGGSDAAPAPSAAAPAVRLHMTVRATRGQLAGVPFNDLETRVEADGRQVRLRPLDALLLDGRFGGEVTVVPGRAGATVRIAGALADADGAAVIAYLGPPADTMTGRLSANVDLEQPAGSAPLVERLRGTVGLTARDGTIQGLSAVRRAIVDLSGRAEPVDLGAGTDEYDRMSGTFGMANGRLDTRDLTLVTEDLEVRGQGSIHLARGTVDLDARVLLSPALSAAAGRDLFRHAAEGDRIVLPCRITGPLGSPTVTLDIAEAAERALRNRLQEEASSLLDRLLKGRK
jgi:hypothetical protein